MKRGFLFLSSAIAGVLFIAALQIIGTDAAPRSVPASDRLSIAEPQYSGQWKGDDLTVEFSYSKDQEQMDLSGKVLFSYSMLMGYSRLEDFRLAAIFLDENGRVIKETGLATNAGPLDPIPFHNRIKLPSNAAFMAFSYQGKAFESGNDKGGGITSFWHSPAY
ncbi:MAG: hypothetical protein ABSF90_24585 [Syntrophobacteraceae bacterium]|jgi:hypothetical protein